MNAKDIDLSKLPTEFVGCSWNDGWEFGAPAVVYSPWEYRCFSDDGDVEGLVETIAIGIAVGRPEGTRSLDEEMKWRKWGKNFCRRRKAKHTVVRLKWFIDKHGELAFEFLESEAKP